MYLITSEKVKNLSIFFVQMKKKLIVFLSFALILLAWCNNSKVTEIDANTRTSKEWLSVEKAFDNQIEEAQYIQDLQDFISYDVSLTTEDKPFVSDISLVADFDGQSSVQWWVSYSQQKYSKSHDLENREIVFDVKAEESQDDSEPFYASWSLSLLYQNNEMYANIHDFGVYMWEGNMLAKMYTLLWDSLIGKWVDLEAHSWWIIVLNEKEDVKLQYILWTLKNVLKSEWINEDSPNFLNGIAELIDTVNSHIDLWVSTDGLRLLSKENKYFELSDWSIQRMFTGSFQWDYSSFDLSFVVSKKWLQVHFYNIKNYGYDGEELDYRDTDYEISFSIQENSKSDYSVKFQSLQSKQTVVDLDWVLKYDNWAKFIGKFTLEPLELAQWQKISWNIEWKIIKTVPNGNETIPELSWETVSLSSILSSL